MENAAKPDSLTQLLAYAQAAKNMKLATELTKAGAKSKEAIEFAKSIGAAHVKERAETLRMYSDDEILNKPDFVAKDLENVMAQGDNKILNP